jgi:hypothetical protein
LQFLNGGQVPIKKFVLAAALVPLLCAGAGNASAAIAYSDAAFVTAPLQAWVGLLGLDFHVNAGITVTALGAFNDGYATNLAGSDGTSGVTVAIFRLDGTQVGPSVHFSPTDAGTQIAGDAFKPVSFMLSLGDYSVVSLNDVNFNASGSPNLFQTVDTLGGKISLINGARYDYGSVFALPAISDGGPANRYDAGTFQFIPEPASTVALGAGLFALGMIRRRRARS